MAQCSPAQISSFPPSPVRLEDLGHENLGHAGRDAKALIVDRAPEDRPAVVRVMAV